MAENEKLEQMSSEKATKEKKSEKSSKPSFFQRAVKWLKELKGDLKKVQWPTKKQTINNTVVVFVVAAIVMVVVYLMDITFGTIRDLIITLVN